MTKEEFETALEKYVAGVSKMWSEWSSRPTNRNPRIEQCRGSRYIRIVKLQYLNERSVHSFVDTTNGDILKGSWKAPVKNGVRGNILDDDNGLSKVNWHGPLYLR